MPVTTVFHVILCIHALFTERAGCIAQQPQVNARTMEGVATTQLPNSVVTFDIIQTYAALALGTEVCLRCQLLWQRMDLIWCEASKLLAMQGSVAGQLADLSPPCNGVGVLDRSQAGLRSA